ncbi:MAG: Lar family restriction alleviation protein [Firmicutes bacterium]|nr:Lar family restriction alleviation protein [Bacillota bacterium]
MTTETARYAVLNRDIEQNGSGLRAGALVKIISTAENRYNVEGEVHLKGWSTTPVRLRGIERDDLTLIYLNPCPYCGRNAEINDVSYMGKGGYFSLRCSGGSDCPVHMETEGFATPQEAAEAWNTRAEVAYPTKTGRTDDDGNDIFAGDAVEVISWFVCCLEPRPNIIGVVVYSDRMSAFVVRSWTEEHLLGYFDWVRKICLSDKEKAEINEAYEKRRKDAGQTFKVEDPLSGKGGRQ